MADGSRQTTWSYDSMGRVLMQQQTINGSPNILGSARSITDSTGHQQSGIGYFPFGQESAGWRRPFQVCAPGTQVIWDPRPKGLRLSADRFSA